MRVVTVTVFRFQLGLIYLLIICCVWSVYFPLVSSPHWYIFLTCSVALGTVVFCLFLVTSRPLYTDNCFKVSLLFCLLVCSLSLSLYLQLPAPDQPDITEAGLFALYVQVRNKTPNPTEQNLSWISQVLLLIYTVIPLPLYGTLSLGMSYSALLEIFAGITLTARDEFTVVVRVLLHFCLHLLGCHILLMTQVRMRDTFMKVGQSLLVKRQLVMEKQLKEKMINSVMPPKVADWLMKRGIEDEDEDVDIDSETGSMMRKISSPRSSNQGDIRTIFRPFNMNAMENVSILFADIVGFTQMSSNKSATQLVELLNDLFGRSIN